MKKKKNLNTWLRNILRTLFLDNLMKAPFMSKKPNENDEIDDSLATMTMISLKLYTGIIKNIKDNEFEISAILLRSLLETKANISFLINQDGTSRKVSALNFLKTAKLALHNLFSINSKEKSIDIKWSNKSIAKRIYLLGATEVKTYKYLSSFIHCDEGFMSPYYHNQRKKLGIFFEGEASLYMFDILEDLAKFGLLEKTGYHFNFIKTVKNTLSELKA
jgi:hypothetical protein